MKDDLFFWVALAILAIWLGPLMTIWALNTAFGLSIAFTFKTWLAVLWIGGLIGGSSAAGGK